MISLDQVMLLEQKVESAVAKIQQLQAENDALRSKCSELTNALSSKSEQLSSFETDQSQIEDGIKKALDRLNQIENSVLKVAAGQAASVSPVNIQPAAQVQTNPANAVNSAASIQQAQGSQPLTDNFFTMNEAPAPQDFTEEEAEEENPDNLGFDIF